ncbi:MAG: helix-turn-helix transcriptional regulator [Treponema sp.]|jgi:DNA-binding CsgD family transcriptional regulator|nr:helix-turn-helix transcriptional regulator [Treponema sp.]
MKNERQSYLKVIFTFFFFHFSLFICYAQVASRTDGVTVSYYDSLHEAFAATTGTSIEQPDEIILLVDIVSDAPLTVEDGQHIRLVAGGSDRAIHRSPDLIEFPVLWVNGDSSSLTLGKPGMEHELVIDGGYLDSPSIEAHCPLVSVCGPGAKLIMYDKVSLQNNKNSGAPLDTSYYENGAGVFIRTRGDVQSRKAEFVMKGGTIRGNINNLQTSLAFGGGVYMAAFGIFTMEGGVIMNNTALFVGGGLGMGSRASFYKTGGIIYGSNAPTGYRNTVLIGNGQPKKYGHAVWVFVALKPLAQYRNDTVGENENISYTGVPRGSGVFGDGDKWDNPDKAFRRILLSIILPVLPLIIGVFLLLRKRALQRLMRIAKEAADTALESIFENLNLTAREKEVGSLLLTELSMSQISSVMKLTYATADYHAKKLYRKMGIKGRTELLLKRKGMGSGE